MFDNIKIGTKLIGSFLAGAIVLMLIAAIGYVNIKAIANRSDKMYKQNIAAIEEMDSIKVGLEKMRANVYRYFDVPAERSKMAQSIKETISTVNESMQAYKNRDIGADERRLIADFDKAWPEMQRGYVAIMKAADEGKNDEVASLLDAGNYVYQSRVKIAAAVGALNEINRKNAEAANKANSDAAATASAVVLLTTVLALAVSLALGLIFARSITGPLSKGVAMIQEMGKGHLSGRLHLKRKDEIGTLTQAMDQFADNLQKNVIFSMQQISEGNIDLTPAIADDKDEIGPTLNKMVNAIGAMSNEIRRCCIAAFEGDLSNRADATPYQGKYYKIVQGFNDTMDAIMGPVNEASDVLNRVANKDMTSRMNGDYKGDHVLIKKSLNIAVENLEKVLQQVVVGAEQVASASVQVSTGGQTLSRGASEQASSLEEISSSLQEMSSMTRQNAMNAREAMVIAEEARNSASKGVESMNKLSIAINQIEASSDATAKIVKTIDEIAFQTNLLALNAAVEAARAGDAGKGFAVVAEEVRNLAMRSAEAAKNTANLIEEAVKNSENGVVINAEVLKNFQEITGKAGKVSQVVAEIAAASDQQDQGITQVNKAVEQLNQLTQQNAANAEESAGAAEEMSSQSEEMRSIVATFTLNRSGNFDKIMQIS